MQWDASENAGFTTGTPWLKVGHSYQEINVEKEKKGKIFPFYQKLIKLRKELPIIAEGTYKAALRDSEQVYAFERELDNQSLLVLNNFFAKEVSVKLPESYQNGQILISNYDDEMLLGGSIRLKAYQTIAILGRY